MCYAEFEVSAEIDIEQDGFFQTYKSSVAVCSTGAQTLCSQAVHGNLELVSSIHHYW